MGIGMESIVSDADASLKGIVPRAISAIFETLNFKKSQNESFESLVSVSFLELYNEELIDLLNPKANNTPAPVIREDANGQIIWQNLSEEHVNSVEELMMYYFLTRVLEKGTLCRTTASTDMNATSSRSHAIFTVNLRQSFTQLIHGEDGTENNVKSNLVSKFHFVDLAGSERLKRTNAQGNRKKEGISINQGLLALGNVISALGDENRKSSHVPYRDSKLTRMLQDSLGGNSQTLMLACISPSDLNYGETVNTLHYANRARNIRNKVEINQDWGSNDSMREIRSLRSTISQLRTEIAMIKANGVQNKDCAIAELGSVTNPKQLAYYQRRERDLMSEIAALKLKLSTITFQKDQFQFLSCRLEDRVRKMMEENSELLKERDIAVSEKCSLLNLGNLDSKRRRLSDVGQGLVKRSRSPSPELTNRNEINGIIGDHLKTIRNLRLQLSNAEDKLAWQQEAMCKLSQKSTKPRLGWDEFAFAELGVGTTPELSVFERIKNENKPSFSRQKQILEAMRENIELNEGPEENQGTDIKQILAKIQEGEGEFGSRLKLRKSYAADNESRDDNPETDLFLLINSIQNDISRHETLMEQNLKREEDYERMQRVYESKLKDLQQKLNNIQTESKYDSERQKIDSEISDTRRKMGENHRLRADNRARNDKLTSELQATISGLKGAII